MTEKIDLLEDNETLVDLIDKILNLEGFKVTQIDPEGTSEEVISVLKETQPDLVIMDVHLRNVNGFDLMKQMKADSQLRNIKIVMISGTDVTYQSEEEGADGFVLKPFMPDDLIMTIKKALGYQVQD